MLQKKQSARGSAHYISGPGNNMVSTRNQLLHYFSIPVHLYTSPVLKDNMNKKKIGQGKCLLNNEFDLRGPGPLGRTRALKLAIFMTKQNV